VSVDGVVLGPLDPEEAGSILRRLRAGGLPVAPLATIPSPPEGRVVRLAGRLRRPALVCVHPGETLANLVEQRGGGIPGGAALKAVLCGGMLIPAHGARVALPPPDPEEAAGSALRILVLDEATCMVDLMALLMARAAARACGRCTLGRLGTRRMAKLAAEIRRGAGAGWIEDLQTLGQQVADGARCVGCRNPASAVVGALAAFPEEAWAHAVSGRCVAGTCRGTT
jgi:NADH:ubiquinone oxidoreductase subunit F (NADH-binding)